MSSLNDALDAAFTRYLLEGFGSKATEIQTLVFDRQQFSEEQAVAWAHRNGFSSTGVDTTSGSYRLRQIAPEQFEGGTFRTIQLRPGVQAVVGDLLDDLSKAESFEDRRDDVYRRYHRAVNMTASELEAWAKNPCSRTASLSRAPIERNLRLLRRSREKWDADDVADARRTIAFVARMRGVEAGQPRRRGCPSPRTVSLRNWAHDPEKTRTSKGGSRVYTRPHKEFMMKDKANNVDALLDEIAAKSGVDDRAVDVEALKSEVEALGPSASVEQFTKAFDAWLKKNFRDVESRKPTQPLGEGTSPHQQNRDEYQRSTTSMQDVVSTDNAPAPGSAHKDSATGAMGPGKGRAPEGGRIFPPLPTAESSRVPPPGAPIGKSADDVDTERLVSAAPGASTVTRRTGW